MLDTTRLWRALRVPPFLAAALTAAALAAITACGDASPSGGNGTTAAGGGTPDAGGEQPAAFQPPGCGFQVAPRPEYIDWAKGTGVVEPDPAIRRVRLGLGGNVKVGAPGRADPATSAGFAWQTDDGTLASDVTWGSTPDPASWPAGNRASGVTWKTPAGQLNGNGDARMHEAYVCGLTPATTYYYRVGGGAPGSEVWSDVYSFTTTPSDPKTEVTIAMTGDARGQANDAWRLLQKRMLVEAPTLQLFSGDMTNFATDQVEWEKWLDLAWKDEAGGLLTLGQLLTVSAHGNHENHTTLFFGNLVLPQDTGAYPSYAELFYSFDVGPVHIVVLDDAFIVSPTGDPGYEKVLTDWLRADLEAANARRKDVPWIVTMHHHAEFSSSSHGTDTDVLRGRAYFVPLWDELHVDLAFAGHDHNYERTKPLTGPAESPTIHTDWKDGTVYMVCAGAGADPYSSGHSDFTEVSLDYKTGGAVGFYALLKATQTSLAVESRELRPDGTDPVVDTFTITK